MPISQQSTIRAAEWHVMGGPRRAQARARRRGRWTGPRVLDAQIP